MALPADVGKSSALPPMRTRATAPPDLDADAALRRTRVVGLREVEESVREADVRGPLVVSAIKPYMGFGVDDHLIRGLMRFIEMISRE
jgi:hypothetical protein